MPGPGQAGAIPSCIYLMPCAKGGGASSICRVEGLLHLLCVAMDAQCLQTVLCVRFVVQWCCYGVARIVIVWHEPNLVGCRYAGMHTTQPEYGCCITQSPAILSRHMMDVFICVCCVELLCEAAGFSCPEPGCWHSVVVVVRGGGETALRKGRG